MYEHQGTHWARLALLRELVGAVFERELMAALGRRRSATPFTPTRARHGVERCERDDFCTL